MMAHVEMKIVDRDLRILAQLNHRDYRSVVDGGSGGVGERLRALLTMGIITSKKGRYGGYRLTRPLSELHFSSWINMLPSHKGSPMMKLLKLFDYTPLREILTYRPYKGVGWTMALDHVVGILSRLSPTVPKLPRMLNYPGLDIGYLSHIYMRLNDCGLIRRIPRKGAVLTCAYEDITVGDILPMVSHGSLVLSALLNYASPVKLAWLYPVS